MSTKTYLTWAEAKLLPHDASGIENPQDYSWVNNNGVYMPRKTIDCTPTWSGVLNWYLAVLTEGKPEGQEIAKKELAKMAKVADAHNEQMKLEILLQIDGDENNVYTVGEFIKANTEKDVEPVPCYHLQKVACLSMGEEMQIHSGAGGTTIIKRIQ